MELLSAFGLDGRLLVANLINFLILVGVLYKFGYKPILKFVKARQETIEKGIAGAEKAEERLREIAEKEKQTRAEARREAQAILARAREQAESQAAAIVKRAEDETKSIVARAKKEIRLEQEQAIARARQEVAGLVVAATEKLLRHKMDEKKDRVFIEGSLKEIR